MQVPKLAPDEQGKGLGGVIARGWIDDGCQRRCESTALPDPCSLRPQSSPSHPLSSGSLRKKKRLSEPSSEIQRLFRDTNLFALQLSLRSARPCPPPLRRRPRRCMPCCRPGRRPDELSYGLRPCHRLTRLWRPATWLMSAKIAIRTLCLMIGRESRLLVPTDPRGTSTRRGSMSSTGNGGGSPPK